MRQRMMETDFALGIGQVPDDKVTCRRGAQPEVADLAEAAI